MFFNSSICSAPRTAGSFGDPCGSVKVASSIQFLIARDCLLVNYFVYALYIMRVSASKFSISRNCIDLYTLSLRTTICMVLSEIMNIVDHLYFCVAGVKYQG